MLEIDIRKALGSFTVEAWFEAGAGITALFGKSGAGKTSIVQMLAGLITPDRGRIVLDGKVLFDTADRTTTPPEQRRIGYIFQDARLFPHMTVRRNLNYGRRRQGERRANVTEDAVTEVLGIGHLLGRRTHDLSGGERQRVAIGRALLTSPRLLLMDEPLASLDAERKREIIPFIDRVHRQFEIPTIYVSHSVEEILELATAMVLLEHGHVTASGTVEKVMNRPELARVVGQGDAGTVIATTVTDQDDMNNLATLAFPGGQFRIPATGMAVGTQARIRVRARDVSLALEQPVKVSVLNVFEGRIAEIAATDGAQADVLVELGKTRLWSRVTAKSVRELGLERGRTVYAMVKAVALDRPGPGP